MFISNTSIADKCAPPTPKVSRILDRGCQFPLSCSYKRLMLLNLKDLTMIPKHIVTYSETIKGKMPLKDGDG